MAQPPVDPRANILNYMIWFSITQSADGKCKCSVCKKWREKASLFGIPEPQFKESVKHGGGKTKTQD